MLHQFDVVMKAYLLLLTKFESVVNIAITSVQKVLNETRKGTFNEMEIVISTSQLKLQPRFYG